MALPGSTRRAEMGLVQAAEGQASLIFSELRRGAPPAARGPPGPAVGSAQSPYAVPRGELGVPLPPMMGPKPCVGRAHSVDRGLGQSWASRNAGVHCSPAERLYVSRGRVGQESLWFSSGSRHFPTEGFPTGLRLHVQP